MEKLNENEDKNKYISVSKENINSFIFRKEYRKAFGLFILFLERLDNDEKRDVIDYYSKNMESFGIFQKGPFEL